MADIAINPVTRRVQFTGNTGTGPFAFTFNILQASDVVVYKNNVLQTLTTDYTVTINANGTGSITMVSALISADVLIIIGGRELSRTTDFVTSGDLLAASLNEQLDSNVIMSQQLDERISRAVRSQPGDELMDLYLPLKADRASKVVGFNSDGDVTVSENTLASIDLAVGAFVNSSANNAGSIFYDPAGSGATRTTVQAKLRERVSVKDFGAVGDGVTDDTAAIQAALDWAFSNGGGIVSGADGEFLASGLVVKANTTFRDGKLKMLVSATPDVSCVSFASDATYSRIVSVTIDGQRDSQTETGLNGVLVDGQNNRVENCHIYDMQNHGISMTAGCDYTTILSNRIHDVSGFGVIHGLSTTTSTSGCTVSFNEVENIGKSGIVWIAGDPTAGASAGIKHWKFTNNTVRNTGLAEVAGAIGGYSPNNEHLLIANNVVENAGNHVFHVGGDFITIVGNVMKNVANGAILLRNWPNDGGGVGAPIGKGCSVVGNVCHLNNDDLSQQTGYGISIEHYTDFTVSGNQIYGSESYGIRVLGEVLGSTTRRSSYGTISGNVIGETAKLGDITEGIYIGASDNITVTGNAVNSSQNTNIAIRSSTFVSVVANTVSGSTAGSGIFVSETGKGSVSSRWITLQGNVCTGNANHGIIVSGSVDNSVVVGNVASGNTVGQINIAGIGTGGQVALNSGLRTKNAGTISRADGDVFPHFVEGTPTRYYIVPTKADRVAAITAVTSTEMTVSLTDLSGTPIAVAEPLQWMASIERT